MEHPGSLRKELEASLSVEATPSAITPSSALVSINIDPSVMPVEMIKTVSSQLLETVELEFKSSLDTSAVKLPQGIQSVNARDLVDHFISNDNLVPFKGGLVPFRDDHTIHIRNMAFGSQTLLADVFGTTNQAEYICKKLAELLWRLVGHERKWGELVDDVNIVSYQTSTVVDLGFSLSELLNPLFLQFLESEIAGVDGLGRRMGPIGQQNRNDGSEFVVSTSLQELDIRVGVFDPVSGEHDMHSINVIPDTKFDKGGGKVKIASALPFNLHVDVVEKLLEKYQER